MVYLPDRGYSHAVPGDSPQAAGGVRESRPCKVRTCDNVNDDLHKGEVNFQLNIQDKISECWACSVMDGSNSCRLGSLATLRDIPRGCRLDLLSAQLKAVYAVETPSIILPLRRRTFHAAVEDAT